MTIREKITKAGCDHFRKLRREDGETPQMSLIMKLEIELDETIKYIQELLDRITVLEKKPDINKLVDMAACDHIWQNTSCLVVHGDGQSCTLEAKCFKCGFSKPKNTL